MRGTVGGVAGLKIKVLSEAERATANFCFGCFDHRLAILVSVNRLRA